MRDRNPAVKLAIGAAFLLALAGAAFAQAAPEIPRFSAAQAGAMPAGWEQIILSRAKKETQYSTVADEGTVVLRAVSRNTASIMATKIDFDPRAFPTLSWRWKVVQGNPAAETANRLILEEHPENYTGGAKLHYGPKAVAGASVVRAQFIGQDDPGGFDLKRTDDSVDVVLGSSFKELGSKTEVNQKIAQLGNPSPPPGTCDADR